MAEEKKTAQDQPAKYKQLSDGAEFILTIEEGEVYRMKNKTHTWSGTASQMRQQFEKV